MEDVPIIEGLSVVCQRNSPDEKNNGLDCCKLCKRIFGNKNMKSNCDDTVQEKAMRTIVHSPSSDNDQL